MKKLIEALNRMAQADITKIEIRPRPVGGDLLVVTTRKSLTPLACVDFFKEGWQPMNETDWCIPVEKISA